MGRAVYSDDKKVMLTCVDLIKKAKKEGTLEEDIKRSERTELTETNQETGKILVKRCLNRSVTKVWLFEPDLLYFCKPIKLTS